MHLTLAYGPAVVDGVMTVVNCYDNQIYTYGMGPSAISVTAPNIGVTTATPITMTGTVLDVSAGAKQNAVAANFPYGLPCVSDDSMSQWMESVYMQQPLPTNATGVPVTLSVIDANNNFRTIGTTTSDLSGTYAHWTPDIPGNYTLIASFAGSQSYYASSHKHTFTPALQRQHLHQLLQLKQILQPRRSHVLHSRCSSRNNHCDRYRGRLNA